MKPTQEQIIAWARESLEECDGTDYYDYTDKLHWWGKADEIVKFASIVAAAEREAIEKAAQMALDVLEHGLPIIEDYGGKQHIQLQHKAIAALYESLNAALAQPKQEIESDRLHAEDDGCPTEKAVLQRFWREHHAQPKREPVAWMYDWYDETEDIDGVPIGGIVSDCISKDYDEAHSPTMGCHNIRPLYTAPPQREWQGLTEMERIDIIDEEITAQNTEHFALAQAIEAKLKEKNHG